MRPMNSRSDEIRALIGALGRPDVCQTCGITTQAVALWIAQGWIPPARYFDLAALGRAKQVGVPEHLFRRIAA